MLVPANPANRLIQTVGPPARPFYTAYRWVLRLPWFHPKTKCCRVANCVPPGGLNMRGLSTTNIIFH
jgi:hypothetical protein